MLIVLAVRVNDAGGGRRFRFGFGCRLGGPLLRQSVAQKEFAESIG